MTTTTIRAAYGGDLATEVPPPAAEFPATFPGVRAPAPAIEASPITERPQGSLLIARVRLLPSPTNPRKTFRGLEEMAETIRAHGILQPLVARPVGDHDELELVFGERRLRAGDLAGLTEFPVLVREMSDLEVLEVQIVENVQRSDVDALEEADGYKVLHEQHGYSVPDIAAKIGKSVAYVYARLKLCALGPEGRAALAEGRLTDSTALLVARIPAALQKDAVKELEPRQQYYGGDDENDENPDIPVDRKKLDPMGAREALARIQTRFMLRLADAPFDPRDAELVPKAGACTACPKRTGSQPELFADVKSADTCTDPTCFGAKRDAAWTKQKTEAKAAGIEVVEGKRAKEYFPYNGTSLSRTSGKIDLDAQDWSHGGPKVRTNRERVAKHLDAFAGMVTLVRTDDGKVHELVPAKVFDKFIPKEKLHHVPASPAVSPAEKMKRAAERAGARVALAAVVKKVEAKELTRTLWRILVGRGVLEGHGDFDDVLERRGILVAGEGSLEERGRKTDAAISRLDANALRGLYVEILLARDADYMTDACELRLFCDELKIDVKQHVAKELARLKSESKTAPATPARDAKAVTKAKKQLAAKKGKKSP